MTKTANFSISWHIKANFPGPTQYALRFPKGTLPSPGALSILELGNFPNVNTTIHKIPSIVLTEVA